MLTGRQHQTFGMLVRHGRRPSQPQSLQENFLGAKMATDGAYDDQYDNDYNHDDADKIERMTMIYDG